MSTSTAAPTHTTESIADRRKQRELAEARQSGAAAPEIDVKTGAIINPHNPEFLTRRPWYLGGGENDVEGGPSLDHQNDQRALQDRVGLSMGASDFLIQQQREKEGALKKVGFRALKPGMYLEGLKRNRKPYLIAKVLRIDVKRETMDVEYEDGSKEKKIKWNTKTSGGNSKLRLTKLGARMALDTGDETERAGMVIGKETYDSKRDAYHGMQVEQQQKLVAQQFQRREELRKQRRAKELERQEKGHQTDGTKKDERDGSNTKKKNKADSDSDDSDSDSDYDSDAGSDSEEEFVQKDEDDKIHTSRLARQGGVGGAQMKVTARNLRIREDTAKYLRNLDPNSAYYDPKSRSMRDNPYQESNPSEVPFAGDNFARISGDAYGLAETQVFAWDASEKYVRSPRPSSIPSHADAERVPILAVKFA
jgi:pre-mRNA-processing factor SLU7